MAQREKEQDRLNRLWLEFERAEQAGNREQMERLMAAIEATENGDDE